MTTDPRATQPIDVRAVCRKIEEKAWHEWECGNDETHPDKSETVADAFAAHFGPLVEALDRVARHNHTLQIETWHNGMTFESCTNFNCHSSRAALAKLREVNE